MLHVRDLASDTLAPLLTRYGLVLRRVADHAPIPGSYWGEEEAGLIGASLYVRDSTPLHSALHEASHFICMDEERRARLQRDAGGDHAEENAVCYMQILLADYLPETSRTRMCADMDTWGYTFRLGSAQRWFEEDAADARAWLRGFELIDESDRVTWRVRR